MVTPAGKASRPDRLRAVSGLKPLKEPRPVVVEPDESGAPVAVVLSKQRLVVSEVLDLWRIDDEWWREEVSRLYYRLLLEDGRAVTLFHDLIGERWYLQSY